MMRRGDRECVGQITTRYCCVWLLQLINCGIIIVGNDEKKTTLQCRFNFGWFDLERWPTIKIRSVTSAAFLFSSYVINFCFFFCYVSSSCCFFPIIYYYFSILIRVLGFFGELFANFLRMLQSKVMNGVLYIRKRAAKKANLFYQTVNYLNYSKVNKIMSKSVNFYFYYS